MSDSQKFFSAIYLVLDANDNSVRAIHIAVKSPKTTVPKSLEFSSCVVSKNVSQPGYAKSLIEMLYTSFVSSFPRPVRMEIALL